MVDMLKDLLTCKEGVKQISGTSLAGLSELDVPAMAVIQCHQGINSLLVETISGLWGRLFDEDHPYALLAWKQPLRETERDSAESETEKDSTVVEDTTELECISKHRELIRRFLEDSFPDSDYSDYFELDHAPNMCASDQKVGMKEGFPDEDDEYIHGLFTQDFYGMRDSSGRTVGHILVARGPQITIPFDLLLFSEAVLNQPDWDPVERGCWEYKGSRYEISLLTVHEVNGYAYYDSKVSLAEDTYSLRFLTLEQIIFTSPYLTDTARVKWLEFLNSYLRGFIKLEPKVFSRPSAVHAGVCISLCLNSLQQSVLMGDTTRVKTLAQDDRYYDPARIINQFNSSRVSKSALQFAAERGDPGMMRAILRSGKFDTHYEDKEGNTLLHTAVLCEDATFIPVMLTDFLEIPDNSSGKLPDLEQSLKVKVMDQQSEKEERYRESRRQGCVNLLLQEGLDIWETNNSGDIADPGPKASPDYNSWWFEKLTQETQDQKANFNAAATAISVTAALVATASYVGPLQPPLGYSLEDGDQIAKVQAGVLPVRVFFVCNTLAFYLAIAAVVLSLTPSLPMPHESTSEELKRVRRSVTWALLFLIASLVTVITAFGSTSIVVIPNGWKWNHGELTASCVVVGSIICLAVLILCCTRAVKLVCHHNTVVDRFYKKWVCI
ncbi:hypothetical protein R1sor_026218 [Riccia sorocarpa]|uniref:PGG domain-containing protein n=1 Tax=Riccia sorocarpa TaxID=122646 RepID=A0ABD3GE25_9MARC